MNTMNYKGYAARIKYSDEDDCFVGHIAGINDIYLSLIIFRFFGISSGIDLEAFFNQKISL